MKPTQSILILLSLFLIFSCENPVEPLVCDEGLTDVDGECYYQGDLDVLKDIIDVNESFNGEEPLEIGGQLWKDGKLEGLFFSRNQLTSLPESIGNLSSLRWLYLEGNHLTILPESIGNLSSLVELYLNSNQLTSLPESIGNLSRLWRLDLYDNHLTTLPESIGNLSSLWLLLLWDNHLTILPESIGNLSSLERLDLYNNQLITLPESICNIPDDCSIVVMKNKLCEEYPYDCIDNWGEQDCDD